MHYIQVMKFVLDDYVHCIIYALMMYASLIYACMIYAWLCRIVRGMSETLLKEKHSLSCHQKYPCWKPLTKSVLKNFYASYKNTTNSFY